MNNYSTTVDNNYAMISSFDLIEGMTIPCEIFYKQNGNYSVALRNSTINKVSLIQLQKLEITYGNIFVYESDLAKIQNQIKLYTDNATFKQFHNKFENIQNQSDNVIDNAFKNKTVDKLISDTVSFNIKDTVVTFEASQILQAINNVNDENKYLYNHSIHVAFLNGLMGKWLNLTEIEIQKLVKIGFLHDIGKTKIPEQILNKPAVLTDEEFDIIKTHPIHSFNMLVAAGENDIEVLLAVRGHHEKTNGTGYPDQLEYDKISLFARITTISDIYDAMVSKRVYKNLHSPFEVLDEFSRGRFSNLDTHLINVFLQNMPAELIGKKVLLSDGRIGTVVYINAKSYAYPLVNVEDEIISTSEKLKCISICE